MTDAAVRVFLVDDHHLFRSGVRAELGAHADVVGEASEVDAAIEMIGERLPDVVLVDVHMPDGGGEAVIRAVLAEHPDVRFLALSVSDAPEDVITVIRAGARGYVTKTISGPELVDAIRRVAADDAVFSPRLAGFVLDAFAHVPVDAVDPELDQLTPRARGAAPHRTRLRVQGDRDASSTSRPRRSRATCRRCSASCSCRTATSSAAGRPSAGSSEPRSDAGLPYPGVIVRCASCQPRCAPHEHVVVLTHGAQHRLRRGGPKNRKYDRTVARSSLSRSTAIVVST